MLKGRKKTFEVFTVSAIDIFASTLGAFLLITTLILPFFPNEAPEPARRRSDFVAAVLITDTRCADLDLHVIERTAGVENHYFYNDKTPGGNTPGLSLDHIVGPGSEIWELEAVRPNATYSFGIQFYSRNLSKDQCEGASNAQASAELRLYHNAGFSKLDDILIFYESGAEPFYLVEMETDEDVEFKIRLLIREMNGKVLEISGATESLP